VAARTDAALAFVLEGGYHPPVLAGSVRAVDDALGGCAPAAASGSVDVEASRVLDDVRARTPTA
jgi:hypothetical protein